MVDDSLQKGAAGLVSAPETKLTLKVSQEHVQGSRFFTQPLLSVGALAAYAGGKHAVRADGGLEGLFVYVGLTLHHNGFFESCFCGRQAFPCRIHSSRNHNEHPE